MGQAQLCKQWYKMVLSRRRLLVLQKSDSQLCERKMFPDLQMLAEMLKFVKNW